MCCKRRPGIRHTDNLPRLPETAALRHRLRPFTRLAPSSPPSPSPLSRESPTVPTIAVLSEILGTNGDGRFTCWGISLVRDAVRRRAGAVSGSPGAALPPRSSAPFRAPSREAGLREAFLTTRLLHWYARS